MTAPPFEILYDNPPQPRITEVPLDYGTEGIQRTTAAPYPKAMIPGLSEEKKTQIKRFLAEKIKQAQNDHDQLDQKYAILEELYRALPGPPKKIPFDGACNDVVPAAAMAADPIIARLDTGIFKQDPVFTLKGLKKSVLEYIPALTAWVDFNQKHRWNLRQIAGQRFLEFVKLGTMVFKTVYDREEVSIKTYDEKFDVVQKREVRYRGPRIFGVSIGDCFFPKGYSDVKQMPWFFERQRTTFNRLKVLEESGKIIDADKCWKRELHDTSQLETARTEANRQTSSEIPPTELTVFHCLFEYDMTEGIEQSVPGPDGKVTRGPKPSAAERLIADYHPETDTLLSLRYNWYFHQRNYYTVIPYTITSDSILGLGVCEMVLPFQIMLTRWQQMASDNAYLANIRFFVAKKGSGIEEVPRLYAGRTFFVDNPKEDFLPLQAGEMYASTLTERQNLFGLAEKRTGVSDYLTGRESPIIGTRATATSTLALIQEGTKRVEQVLENIRNGFAEILEMAFYIWMQYGTEEIDTLVFGDDEIGAKVKDFFTNKVTEANLYGCFAIDLTATDASGSRQVVQQLQLNIIQVMMSYLEKLLQAGQAALMAKSQLPEYSQMVVEVMTAARKMFKDLLHKFDIRNPEDYLPDLEKFVNDYKPQPVPPGGAVGGAGEPTAGPSVAPTSQPA
jgi:hypothetical protein